MKTPTTPEGLRKFDHLPPVEAVWRAWTDPGPNVEWHNRAKQQVQDAMPLLARALDRVVHGEPGSSGWLGDET